MARIRTVKPEFFRHEGLQDLEIAHPGAYCMLVFEGLWGHCDSQGIFEYRPRILKLDILPFLPFEMADTLRLLEAAGFLTVYQSGGKQYGKIESFPTHQRFSGKESGEAGVKHPVHGDDDGEATGKQQGSNGANPKSQERKGLKERIKGKESILSDSDVLVKEVLDVLQQESGKRFTLDGAQAGYVRARLKSGATVVELSLVAAHRSVLWRDDPKMRQYLRPETVFCNKHWEAYLQDAEEWELAGRPSPILNGKPPKETLAQAERRILHGR